MNTDRCIFCHRCESVNRCLVYRRLPLKNTVHIREYYILIDSSQNEPFRYACRRLNEPLIFRKMSPSTIFHSAILSFRKPSTVFRNRMAFRIQLAGFPQAVRMGLSASFIAPRAYWIIRPLRSHFSPNLSKWLLASELTKVPND